jgi:hypothetical protein
MKCKHCNREIVLVPSAAERAKKDRAGNPASYYTSLFQYHADCQLELRRVGTLELMRRT